MRLKHFDYTRLVMGTYHKKREQNELSPLLAQPTPAKIRRECANVYKERYRWEDEPMLRAFFGPAEKGKQMLQLIGSFDTDKFRPLVNYLKNDTEKTDDKNLELLAWLIDFPHRPYGSDRPVLLSPAEIALPDETVVIRQGTEQDDLQNPRKPEDVWKDKQGAGVEGQTIDYRPGLSGSINKFRNKKHPRGLIIFLIVVICTGAIYTMTGNANRGCMYWAGDHYEKVACNEESNGRLLLPMNEKRMKQFRRITREDTITERSIGKVFYIKDSNTLKYYTEGGSYPEDLNRTLKKLSRYLFEKDSVNRISKNGLP